jgi:hypothetical protein
MPALPNNYFYNGPYFGQWTYSHILGKVFDGIQFRTVISVLIVCVTLS